MILDTIPRVTIKNSASILAFTTAGTGNDVFPFWDRFLMIDGKKSYHIGVACSECPFSFERIDEDSVSRRKTINTLSQEMLSTLNNGLTKLDSSFIELLKPLMPDGNYYVVLSKVIPTLVKPHQPGDYFSEEQVDLIGLGPDGLPHYTKTKYYRCNNEVIPYEYKRGLFEFIIPLLTLGWLDPEKVSEYKELLIQGIIPTAVTLSVLHVGESPHHLRDEKNSALYSHTCLSHYLIEGHRKVYAAAMLKKPIPMISFIAIEQYSGAEYEINECINVLQTL